MDNSNETEVLEETKTETSKGKTKELILHNDDYNSFQHVEKCMMNYVSMTSEQSSQVAMVVHYRGKCVIKRGEEEEIKELYNKLRGESLTVSIEG